MYVRLGGFKKYTYFTVEQIIKELRDRGLINPLEVRNEHDLSDSTTLNPKTIEQILIEFGLWDLVPIKIGVEEHLNQTFLLHDAAEVLIQSHEEIEFTPCFYDTADIDAFTQEDIIVEYLIDDHSEISVDAEDSLEVTHLLEDENPINIDTEEQLELWFALQDWSEIELDVTEQIATEFDLVSDPIEICLKARENLCVKYVLEDTAHIEINDYESLEAEIHLVEDVMLDLTTSEQLHFENHLTDTFDIGLVTKETTHIDFDLRDTATVNLDATEALSLRLNLQSNADLSLATEEKLAVTIALRDTNIIDAVVNEKPFISFLLNDPFDLSLTLTEKLALSLFLKDTAEISLDTASYNPVIPHTLKDTLDISLVSNDKLFYAIQMRDNANIDLVVSEALNTYTLYEPEMVALLARMPIPPVYKIRESMNTYIKALKAAGIWQLLDLLQVYATNNSENARLNWVKNEFNSQLIGSPTFTPLKCFSGDGKGCLTTGMNPSLSTNLYKQNNSFMYERVLNSVADSIMDFGVANAFINSRVTILLIPNLQMSANSGVNLLTIAATGQGGYSWSRSNAAGFDMYNNGVPVTLALTSGSVAPTNDTFKVCGTGANSATSSFTQIAVVAAGAALTPAQNKIFHDETDLHLTRVGAI